MRTDTAAGRPGARVSVAAIHVLKEVRGWKRQNSDKSASSAFAVKGTVESTFPRAWRFVGGSGFVLGGGLGY